MKANWTVPLDLGEVRHGLAMWRKTRRRGERIPQRLWAVAAALARARGVSLVSRTLGLDYCGLKRRAEAATAGRPKRRGLEAPPGFVEVPLIGGPGPAPNCTVELERGAGRRMTIRWEGQPALDWVGLAEAFWRQRP